jgi:hypothetical protein
MIPKERTANNEVARMRVRVGFTRRIPGFLIIAGVNLGAAFLVPAPERRNGVVS